MQAMCASRYGLHMTSFRTQRLYAESLSICNGMSHERKISECALASPGVRKRRKCADPESVLFTHPCVTERLPSLVADPSFLQEMKCMLTKIRAMCPGSHAHQSMHLL